MGKGLFLLILKFCMAFLLAPFTILAIHIYMHALVCGLQSTKHNPIGRRGTRLHRLTSEIWKNTELAGGLLKGQGHEI